MAWLPLTPAVARLSMMVPPLPDPLPKLTEFALVSVWISSSPEPPPLKRTMAPVGSAAVFARTTRPAPLPENVTLFPPLPVKLLDAPNNNQPPPVLVMAAPDPESEPLR